MYATYISEKQGVQGFPNMQSSFEVVVANTKTKLFKHPTYDMSFKSMKFNDMNVYLL